jgi:hypothetical protein
MNKKNIKVSFVIEKNNGVKGFALFLIPRETIIEKSDREVLVTIFLPLIMGILCIIVILTTRVIYLKKHILEPIKEMNESSKGSK